MRMQTVVLIYLSGAFILTCPMLAGVYTGTAVCSVSADCAPLVFVSDPYNTVPPFAITHPPGYDGSGGALQLRICVAEGSEMLIGPASRAIATWNLLTATTGNCAGCLVWEENPSDIQIAHAETTLLHELGHCPLGLDHPDRNWDAQNPPDGFWEPTSFTRSWSVAAPPNGIGAGPVLSAAHLMMFSRPAWGRSQKQCTGFESLTTTL